MQTDKQKHQAGYRISRVTGHRLPSKNKLKELIKKANEKLRLLELQLLEHLD